MPQPKVDTVVRGGLVVTGTGAVETSLAIKDGKIAAIGPADLLPHADHTIDAAGKYVLPGLIDCHCHFRGWEDYALATRMAAAAGLTTIVPFGITNVAQGETLPDAIKRHQDEVARVAVCDVAFHFQLGADPKILDGIEKAAELGVRSFKMFMSYKTRRPPVMVDDEFILQAMERIAAANGVTQLHCENGDAINFNERKLIAAGAVKPTDFPKAAPEWVEAEAINRAIELSAAARCATYVVHLSTRLGLERIRQAQAAGQSVWTETCPQYLVLAAEDMEKWGPLLKIGPPLRRRASGNHEALWNGLADGAISCIGSDHSPHPREVKDQGWDNVFYQPDGSPVPFGSPAIETLAPVVYSKGIAERGLPLHWLARAMSENPARIFGLYPRKGTIQVGSDADLTIIDPNGETEISSKRLLGKAGYTPYEGWKLRGKIAMTLLRGRVLMDEGKVLASPGSGEFRASGPSVAPI
ncbi:MAG: amidohydrolase family protein [Chloroflexi bacterium]|nr:amidohydrolase family protein [Chloroflexota bacterium]